MKRERERERERERCENKIENEREYWQDTIDWEGKGREIVREREVCQFGNLLSFLLRCGTRPYERGTQWDSNSLV